MHMSEQIRRLSLRHTCVDNKEYVQYDSSAIIVYCNCFLVPVNIQPEDKNVNTMTTFYEKRIF